MDQKILRLSPKKGGHGYITSYTVNIGSAEARACGFINQDGQCMLLEKTVDESAKCIVIKLANGDDPSGNS